VRMSGWKGEQPLLDPFCGSGTVLAEALMAAADIPSGYLHSSFGFERLPDHDAGAWAKEKKAIDDAIKPIKKGLIRGSDIEPEAVRMARKNLSKLPGGRNIDVKVADAMKLDAFENGTIVTNPPYGLRIGNRNRITDLFKGFGDFLKQRCTGSSAFIYVGKPALLKSVGLRATWKKELVNGALEGRLARYDMYAGREPRKKSSDDQG